MIENRKDIREIEPSTEEHKTSQVKQKYDYQ